MTALIAKTSSFVAALAHVEQAPAAAIESVRGYFRRRATYLRIRDELLAYTDRGLSDIGICAGDIERIAREGARGA